MLKIKEGERKIYIRCGKSDMRKGIDGLSLLVVEELGESILFDQEAIFLFCGRKKDRYKTLSREKDGFAMSYKRIESGKIQWPREEEAGIIQIDEQRYRWLLEGISIWQPKAIKEAEGGSIA